MNRIKVVLVEKKKTQKWLAKQLNISSSQVNNYCQNLSQPTMKRLYQIAEIFEVKVNDLLENEI